MLRYDPNPDTVLSHERNLLFAGGVIGRIGNGKEGVCLPGSVTALHSVRRIPNFLAQGGLSVHNAVS